MQGAGSEASLKGPWEGQKAYKKWTCGRLGVESLLRQNGGGGCSGSGGSLFHQKKGGKETAKNEWTIAKKGKKEESQKGRQGKRRGNPYHKRASREEGELRKGRSAMT